ncbi:MAG TPA: VOC family protein [Thermomicrobiales bacterium]|jgi:catechol 2,3-dioxygenase-like lactoylglutathione lyase family enzyme|nr:VOC family protein [Thermomicrobiales bacterium]
MEWKLEVVIIPVSDVDRAKRFYADQLGFNVDVDQQISADFRVVQTTPPGSACSVTFGTGLAAGAEPGSGPPMQLVVSDIDAAHAQLTGAGVDVSGIFHFEEGRQMPGPGGDWNSFFSFQDPDGNQWTVQQRPATA